MQKSLFPGYTIGTDAYEDIAAVCPAFGKKAAIIGGKRAVAAAADQIIAAAKKAGIEVIRRRGHPREYRHADAPSGRCRHDFRRGRR